MAELRPDLRLTAVDLQGKPEAYPRGCEFVRLNLEADVFPWPDNSIDGITCMHLVEHLQSYEHMVAEVARVLKPGGRVYFETPHPKTLRFNSPSGPAAGTFTMNFYDDPTHVRVVSVGSLAKKIREAGLTVEQTGTSRNWLFAVAWLVLWLAPASRKKFTAQAHWRGWSAYLIARQAS